MDPKNRDYVGNMWRRHVKNSGWDGKMTPTIYLTLETPRHGYGDERITTRAIGYRVATAYQTVVSSVLMKIMGNNFVPIEFSRNPKTSAYYTEVISSDSMYSKKLSTESKSTV